MNATASEADLDNDPTCCPLGPRSEGITLCVVYLIQSIAITFGNIITIAVFTRSKTFKKKKYCLLRNLAVADFLVGGVVVPWWTYDLAGYFDLWTIKEPTESAVAVAESIDLTTKYASLISLMAVSLERAYATVCPLKHRLVEAKTYYSIIGLIWTLSLLLPSIRVAHIYGLVPENTFLFATLSFTSVVLLIIIASYVAIWVNIAFGKKPQHDKAAIRSHKLTTTLCLVTVISLLCWLPAPVIYAAFRLIHKSGSTAWSFESYNRVYYSAMALVFANSLLNPIIYPFRLPHFRGAALRLFTKRKSRNAHSSHQTRVTRVTTHPLPSPIPSHLQGPCLPIKSNESKV